MIPILYDSSETTFLSEGLGRLLDATRCEVTEERNGIYELAMSYSVNGPLLKEIQIGRLILAAHDETGDAQPFRIYHISAPIEGVVEINAWHISYELNYIVVSPYSANSCSDALAGILSNSIGTNPFSFWTNRTLSAAFKLDVPTEARSVLGGMQGSILDVFGPGEYEFDTFTVKFWTARGANNGATIWYGKNLKELKYDLDGSNVFNAVVPYWRDENNVVALGYAVVRTGETLKNAIPLDMSADFETQPTTAQLAAAAQSYINGSGSHEIKENITVDFTQLWQTEEYKNVANLERVKLCDTVTIIFEKYNIYATAKVIKVVYNTLLDRYSSIELGAAKMTLAEQITQDAASAAGKIAEDAVSIANAANSAASQAETAATAALSVANGLNTGYAEVPYSNDITGSVTSDASLASISIIDPGVYLIVAEGRVGRTGYAEADRPNIQQGLLVEHLKGSAIYNLVRNFNNLTQTFGINCVAMFECAAGDTIAFILQQRTSAGVALTSQTAHLHYSIIKLK